MAVPSGCPVYNTLNDNQHKVVEDFRYSNTSTLDSQPSYGRSRASSQHDEESRHDSDNNNISLEPRSGTTERHRLDSVRSGDSGYESRRRSRIDSGSSYVTTTTASENRIKGLPIIDTDRNGNDVSLSPIAWHDPQAQVDTDSSCNTRKSTLQHQDTNIGKRDGIETVYPSRIGRVGEHFSGNGLLTRPSQCLCKGERVCTCATDTSKDGNEFIVEVKGGIKQTKDTRESIENYLNDIAETNSLRSYDAEQEEENIEYMNKPIYIQNSVLSESERFGPPQRRHWNHRKSNSFSLELTNESQRLAYRAQTRKRYKSEGNAESDALLAEYDQSREFSDNCKYESEDKKDYGLEANSLNDPTKKHLSPNRDDYAVDLSESSENVGTFGSESKHAEQDNHGSCSSMASVTLRDKVITEYTVSPKPEIDPADSLRDSLTVNYDKHDLAKSTEERKASSEAPRDSAPDKPTTAGKACRAVCCDVCSCAYVELVTRIDKLTADYQWQNKRTGEAVLSTSQLKVYLTRLFIIGVIIIIVVVTLGLSVVVIRSFLGCNDWVHEVHSRNITSNIASLGQRLGGVADMVNDLMTKSTSILRLTNRNGYSTQAGQHYVTWQTRDHEGQGDLRLSDTGDSVIMTSGGYYVIYVKLQYTTTLAALTSVRLEYDVVQVAAGGARSVQHTARQFTAASGPLRQEIPTQTTLYAYPGDTVQVRLRPDQLPLLANFSKAHELSMFELK